VRDQFDFLSVWFTSIELTDIRLLVEESRHIGDERRSPIRKRQRAILSAAVVLMVARTEAFIEEAARWSIWEMKHKPSITTIEDPPAITNFHNPTSIKIETLFRSIGIPDIWTPRPKRPRRSDDPLAEFDRLVNLRHDIADGKVSDGNVAFAATLKDVLGFISLLEWFSVAVAEILRKKLQMA